VHLSVDSVGKIERGIGGVPTVETLKNIADALNLPQDIGEKVIQFRSWNLKNLPG